MELDLDRITAAAERETTTDDSILALVTAMAEELRSSGASHNAEVQAVLDGVASKMEANADRILASVNANTQSANPFQNFRIASDVAWEGTATPPDTTYQSRLFTYNSENPNTQIPQSEYVSEESWNNQVPQ